MGMREAWQALWSKPKLDTEKAQEMAQKRWKKEDVKEEIGTFSQMSKLMGEMDTFKQQQIERERQREIEMEQRIYDRVSAEFAEFEAGEEEESEPSFADVVKLFGGVNPQTATQAPPQNNALPTILQNPKVQLLIQAFDKIPEDKLKGLLEKLEAWTK